MNFGERLKYIRNIKNISIYKLSQDSDVSENHIRNLERGLKQPTIATIEQIVKSLDMTLSEFFNENNKVIYPTKEENNLIEYYRTLPKEKGKALITFCKTMTE